MANKQHNITNLERARDNCSGMMQDCDTLKTGCAIIDGPLDHAKKMMLNARQQFIELINIHETVLGVEERKDPNPEVPEKDKATT